MSNQGTVLQDWVRAVSEALDVPYTGKVSTMRALVEQVGQTWDPGTMASERTLSRGGGNISTPAFQALLLGLQSQPAAQRRKSLNENEVEFRPPAPNAQDDKKAMRAVRVRRGQPQFRAALLSAYEGRCAFTGYNIAATLEAAHIRPYGSGGTYETSNGILLRADIHTLFDLLLVAVDPGTGKVLLHPELEGSSYEFELQGVAMRPPSHQSHRPDKSALQAHRERCAF